MITADILDRLRILGSSLVSDANGRGAALGGFTVFSGGPNLSFAGRARTVEVVPGGNLSLHQLIPLVQPGEVVIVDAGGAVERAIAGEIIATALQQRRAVGLVVHGAIRDVSRLAASNLPILARGSSPLGPNKTEGGGVDIDLAMNGVVIRSGDVVVGDADGIAVVPVARTLEVLAAAEAILDKEKEWKKNLQTGRPLPFSG